jgi:ABC-type multidrug transport system permease subunit
MLGTLLHKDFRRILRNPWPTILNLGLPLAITALIGLAFGGTSKQGPSIARIRVAVVDEDQSIIGSVLKSGLSQGEAATHFEPVVVATRAEALRLVQNDKFSAAIIVPAHFTKNFLLGGTNLSLEVIKNPAQSLYPAIVEELLEVAVTGLNAISQNFQSEFPALRQALTNEFDLVQIAAVLGRLGNRAQTARDYLNPPLITYHTVVTESTAGENADGPGIGIFAFILPGMASAFLLFLADHSLRDVHRERRLRTLDRLVTMTDGIRAFVAGKIIFAGLVVIAGSAILFLTSALAFGIRWRNPGLMSLASVAYAFFAAGFMAVLVALAPNERRSETINNILLFALAFAGGSYFPARQLPEFMQKYICPLMPNYWFTEAIRALQEGGSNLGPLFAVVKLGIAGVVLALIASWVLQRRLSTGSRA